MRKPNIMDEYYYVPGMMNPYWYVSRVHDYPKPGDVTAMAHNADSDTDMGDLFGDEFDNYFPNAMPITEQQMADRSVTDDDWKRWHDQTCS